VDEGIVAIEQESSPPCYAMIGLKIEGAVWSNAMVLLYEKKPVRFLSDEATANELLPHSTE